MPRLRIFVQSAVPIIQRANAFAAIAVLHSPPSALFYSRRRPRTPLLRFELQTGQAMLLAPLMVNAAI